jgi:hypothetical protein
MCDRQRVRRVTRIEQLGDAEIQQLGRAFGRDQDVGRLQVAMDDARAVGGVERIADLASVLQDVVELEWALERFSLDVLHHQIVRADVVQRADVRMIEGGDRTRFALEPVRERRLQNLDRDRAIQARIVGFVHLAHAASAELFSEGVGAESSGGDDRLFERRIGHVALFQ